jgi:hypothetical protein
MKKIANRKHRKVTTTLPSPKPFNSVFFGDGSSEKGKYTPVFVVERTADLAHSSIRERWRIAVT